MHKRRATHESADPLSSILTIQTNGLPRSSLISRFDLSEASPGASNWSPRPCQITTGIVSGASGRLVAYATRERSGRSRSIALGERLISLGRNEYASRLESG